MRSVPKVMAKPRVTTLARYAPEEVTVTAAGSEPKAVTTTTTTEPSQRHATTTMGYAPKVAGTADLRRRQRM